MRISFLIFADEIMEEMIFIYTFTNPIRRLKVEDIVGMSSSPLYLGPPNETKTSGSHIIGIYYVPGHFVVRAQMDVARNRKKNK